jgi:hypothetical protein
VQDRVTSIVGKYVRAPKATSPFLHVQEVDFGSLGLSVLTKEGMY